MFTVQSDPSLTRYLRTKEAAAFLGVRPATLRNWKALGIAPPSRKLSGTLVVYAVEDLRAWLDRREQAHATKHNAPASQAGARGEG